MALDKNNKELQVGNPVRVQFGPVNVTGTYSGVRLGWASVKVGSEWMEVEFHNVESLIRTKPLELFPTDSVIKANLGNRIFQKGPGGWQEPGSESHFSNEELLQFNWVEAGRFDVLWPKDFSKDYVEDYEPDPYDEYDDEPVKQDGPQEFQSLDEAREAGVYAVQDKEGDRVYFNLVERVWVSEGNVWYLKGDVINEPGRAFAPYKKITDEPVDARYKAFHAYQQCKNDDEL